MDGMCVFGEYELYPTMRVLRRSGNEIAIGSRAFDLLVALVKQHGEVLSQSDLKEAAWPEVFVEDSNIRVQIAALRKELGCGLDGVRYIVSIPGRGYCFVAPTTWCSEPRVCYEQSQKIKAEAQSGEDLCSSSTAGNTDVIGLPSRIEKVFGRDDDLTTLMRVLHERRLVTLVGCGGVGKTTLALVAGHQAKCVFKEVLFVDLSLLSEDDFVYEAVANVIERLDIGKDIAPISEACDNDRVLLILDNCEHIIENAATSIELLLSTHLGVTVLATSREALRVADEAIYLLRPLAAPRAADALDLSNASQWPAMALFMDRAIQCGGDRPLDDSQARFIGEICRRLDGNPLAIELVATRAATYGFARLAELVSEQLILHWRFHRSAVPRHQTVKALLNWSHDLLSRRDQEVMHGLSVFGGSFSLDAALAILASESLSEADVAEAIGNLIDKSLIGCHFGEGAASFYMIDTTKTFAAMELASSGQSSRIRSAHAQYFLLQLRQYAGEAKATRGNYHGVRASFDTVNVRLALEWAFSVEGHKELVLEFCNLAVPALADLLVSAKARVEVLSEALVQPTLAQVSK